MRYGVYKRYQYSTMPHLHSIELTERLAKVIAKAVSRWSEVEVTWIEEIMEPTYDSNLQIDGTVQYIFGSVIAHYSPAAGCWLTYRANDTRSYMHGMIDVGIAFCYLGE